MPGNVTTTSDDTSKVVDAEPAVIECKSGGRSAITAARGESILAKVLADVGAVRVIKDGRPKVL